MSATSETDLKAKYSKILKDNGIDDEIAQVTLTKPDLAGEHFGSIVELARVDFEDGGKPPLEFFLKKRLTSLGGPLEDDQMRKVMLKEGYFLKEFAQELNELCKERSNGSFILTSEIVPKTFYYDEDVIVMENLTKKGYSILDKKKRQDFTTASAVVRHLAKLHAATFVAVENAGGGKPFLEANPNFEETMFVRGGLEMLSKMFDPGFDLAFEIIKGSTHPEKDEKYEMLAKYKNKICEVMCETIEAENLFHCVLHGDCWNNNMMFDNTMEKVVLVDFQLSRVGSPSLDLSYFIFTSTKPEVRKRWKELLQIYFDSLKANLESLGQAFEFKFEDFVDDFRRKSKMGFFMGFYLIIGFEAFGTQESKPEENFASSFTNMVRTWIENNPDKAESAAESMITMVNDYLLFGKL